MRPYWQSEEHGLAIYHGDCLEVMPALEQEFDLCLTDIPYQISQESNGLRNLHYGEWDVGGTPVETVLTCAAACQSACIFCDGRQLSAVIQGLDVAGFSTRQLAWHKSNPSVLNGSSLFLSAVELAAYGKQAGAYFGGHCVHNLIECSTVATGIRIHPTQKPMAVMRRIVELCCPPDGIVLDPFLGSASSLVACYRLGRRGVGIEISEEYCELAAERLEAELAQLRLPETVATAQPAQLVMEQDAEG